MLGNTGKLSKTGYSFAGRNTTADISGTKGWALDSANPAGFIPASGNAKSPGV